MGADDNPYRPPAYEAVERSAEEPEERTVVDMMALGIIAFGMASIASALFALAMAC